MPSTKKQIVALGLAVSFGLLPAITGAQVPGTDTRQNIRETREAMNKGRIKLLGEKAILRLTASLNRADGFRERVALHASQFPNPRFNKTTVDQKLAEAGIAIANGRAAVAAIQTAMDGAIAAAGGETNGSFTDVRAKIREAMAAIRAAHLKVVEAIRLIKAGYPPTPISTTTPVNPAP